MSTVSSKISLIFLGSFQNHSVTTLDILYQSSLFSITAVITSANSTPVRDYSQTHHLPILTPDNLQSLPPFNPPDFMVVAGFGLLLPTTWLKFPKIMAVNLHPSLLPAYPGRFPAQWAILMGETATGVSLIKMSPRFDSGHLIHQSSLPILTSDTQESLYRKLYQLSGQICIDFLPQLKSGKLNLHPQPHQPHFYARQLTRPDGFLPWPVFQQITQTGTSSTSSIPTDSAPPLWQEIAKYLKLNQIPLLDFFTRSFRALHPWPGLWTTLPSGKRLKIISPDPLTVQLEGKTPAPWSQIAKYHQ